MACYACSAEAVDRCYNCGRLFCKKHGGENCAVCQNSIQVGDPRPERISETLPRMATATAWWRPQRAEEYAPPECYSCGSLTRAVCAGCRRPYCAKHAGRNFTCADCQVSTDLSLWIVGGFLAAFLLIAMAGYWVSG